MEGGYCSEHFEDSEDSETCDRSGCDRSSKYLFHDIGDRCREHALEDKPETTIMLDWAGGIVQ